VRRDQLSELHYITPITNLPSVLSRGILSHRQAEKVRHRSVAMDEIQKRRTRKRVPGGRALHEYVNLYFCARNPMLFKRKDQHAELCVIRVSTAVLDLPDVVITDQNAASAYALFSPAPDGLKYVDRDLVFAEYWTHGDPIEQYRHRSIKCAEVLVPDSVPPSYILGAYVSGSTAQAAIEALGLDMSVTLSPHLFFR